MSERLSYEAYLHFSSPEENPWRAELISDYLRLLSDESKMPALVTDQEVDTILFCYDQAPSYRAYHGLNHGGFVGQPEAPDVLVEQLSDRYTVEQAKATLALAGLFHDVAYKHVDAIDEVGTRAWPTVLRSLINGMADYSVMTSGGERVFTTRLTDEGKQDEITKMVAHIFDVDEEGIAHNQGGNEFDSALAAAKFLDVKDVLPKHIIAITAAIAATIPFKPAVETDERGLVTDGRMSTLAEKIKSAQLAYSEGVYQPDWQDTNDIMLLSVHLANRDISPFIQPDNFADVVSGGRGIKREEVSELRVASPETIRTLARVATIQRSAPFLHQGLGGNQKPVSARQVPHVYIPRDSKGVPLGIDYSYPPMDIYDEAVGNVERNARMASGFFRAHEAGIVLVASLATLIGEPDAPVPGIVDANHWRSSTRPQGEIFDNLSEEEMLVYNELMYGFSQTDIDVITHHRSPVGGMIYGAVGSQEMANLSAYIQSLRAQAREIGDQDPFCDPVIAQHYIETIKTLIGSDNFNGILNELDRVARYFLDDPHRGNPDRIARLNALR
jgi:hypothetical protein